MTASKQNNAPITDRPASLQHLGIALLVGTAMTLSLGACSDGDSSTGPAIPEGQPVRVATVGNGRPPARLRLPGVVRAVERAELAFLHAGQLAERLVQRGERVEAGQALAILHNPSLMPGVAGAEARVRELDEQIERLEREAERLTNLHERGLVSTDALDAVTAQRDAARQARGQAEASLTEAREQLAEATLRAPFSGRIVALSVEPGQFVNAGQPVIHLSAPDRLEVAIDLSARQSSRLRVGDEARVRTLENGRQLTGTIREIGLAEPGRPASAVIELPPEAAPEWTPGQAVHAELTWPGESRMSVPLDALIDTGDGLPHVFRHTNGHVELVSVIPGQLDGGRIRVDGELEDGDEVVVAGHGQLLDGERVRVLR
ncbi:MAG: efflux RND transporter periplasmic adaptor subunit [Xanthomonadales bacterium]|nr:efflux RND transporter periplasmic adaptor subunit [Xanthomonadales bacterium]